jgi:Fe-S-cluster containining protein
LACGECCGRYWITLLPEEAKKISKVLKVSEKDFLEKNCILLVKVFPKSVPGILTFPAAFFPKKIYKLIEKRIGFSPQSFFVQPQVALKRKGNRCQFLLRKNECEIYSSRPKVCQLFPFIVLPDYRESYPFCKLYKLQAPEKSDIKESRKHFKEVQKHFKLIDKKGFVEVWKNPPKSGLLFLNEEKMGAISIEEIRLMQIYSNKN